MSSYYPKHDRAAKALGAVGFYDQLVPRRPRYPSYIGCDWHFARYYFNAAGDEVAYFIPDMISFHADDDLLNVHPVPRVWGTPCNLEPLREELDATV